MIMLMGMHVRRSSTLILFPLQAFVSEYAVWKDDAGNGTLLAAVAEAAFLIGLERNRLDL